MRIIKNKNIIITVLSFIFGIILSGMFIVLVTSCIRDIKDCIRYEKVYQNPVVVTGTICDIDIEEDSEGDETYKVYISYTVDGTEYKAQYMSTDSSGSVPDRGEKFTIEVNPDDHSELLKNMISPSFLYFSVPILIMTATFVICNGTSKILLNKKGEADEERIKKDLYVTVFTRSTGKILLFISVAAAALYLRFPFIFHPWLIAVAVVLLVAAAFFIGKNIKNINQIRREEYKIVKSTLYNKYEKSSDDSTNYYLCYRDTEAEWERSVSSAKYSSATPGETVTTVYIGIGEEKKPSIVYDIDGTQKL